MYQDVNGNFTVVCFQNTLYIRHLIIVEASFDDFLNKTIIVICHVRGRIC